MKIQVRDINRDDLDESKDDETPRALHSRIERLLDIIDYYQYVIHLESYKVITVSSCKMHRK